MDTELERDLCGMLESSARDVSPPIGLSDRLIASARAGRGPANAAPTDRRRSWPRSRVWVPVAAAAVTAALILGAAWIRADRDSSTGNGDRSNRTIATAYVEDLLSRARTLPGSHPVDHAPVPAVTNPMISSGRQNLIERKAWWTAPGTIADAIAYFTAHPPRGLSVGASANANDGSAQGLSFGGKSTKAYTSATGLMIVVARAPGGVAVLADAQANWRPDRTAAKTIPTDVMEVQITINPGQKQMPTLERISNRAEILQLVAVVNGLATAFPGPSSCPNDQGYTDELSFRVNGRPNIEVTASVQGCQPVSVTVGGQRQPGLDGGGTVHAAVLKVLGLPTNYGR